MKQLLNRGFTLIELLVVIAIIGILASVVLASLNNARDKGSDAAVKSTLNNMRAQAELHYDDAGNTYDGVCEDTTIGNAVNNADNTNGSGAVNCTDTAAGSGTDFVDDDGTNDGWAVEAALVSDNTLFYCVDHAGNATTTTGTSLANDDSTCG